MFVSNCDKPKYVKSINLIKVDDNKKLGERAGLCKTGLEGEPGKWMAAAVWQLRTTTKSLRARMSPKNTPNARDE